MRLKYGAPRLPIFRYRGRVTLTLETARHVRRVTGGPDRTAGDQRRELAPPGNSSMSQMSLCGSAMTK